MFAVLKTGGKQYKVQSGDVLRVENVGDGDQHGCEARRKRVGRQSAAPPGL